MSLSTVIEDWNIHANANRIIQSYVNDFIDISGSLVIRENANLYVSRDITTNGVLTIADATVSMDVNSNNDLVVGGDVSMNGNVTINSNTSLDGRITSCQFVEGSIPVTAFNGEVPTQTPDYTQPTIIYEQNVEITADASMNSATVEISNIKMDGSIQFGDGTSLNSYSNNLDIIYSTNTKPVLINTNIPSTFISSAISPQMHVSQDGKYVICSRWDNSITSITTTNAGPTRSGAFFSANYGETFTRVVLPQTLTNDLSYSAFLMTTMSNTGKYMMVVTTGSSGTTWLNPVIGWSMDYGNTWSSTDLKGLIQFRIATGNTGIKPINISINHDGSKAAMYLNGTGENTVSTSGVWYADNWSSAPYTWRKGPTPGGSQINYRGMLVKERYIIPNTVASVTLIYNIYDNTNLSYTLTPNNNARFATGLLANEIYTSSTSSNILKRITNIHNTPQENDITLPGSPSTNYRYGAVVSNSGKYVIVGHNSVPSILQPCVELFNATYPPYFSNDYGVTFTGPITLTNTSGQSDTIINVSLSDAGLLYIQYYSTGGNKIVRHDLSIFKPSTFTNLSVINTLTVGANQYTSDYRIKTDVTPLDETITIDHLRPVKYLQTIRNKEQYGLIAHELQQYFPNLVKGEKDGEQLQTVNYTGLIAILVNEIKRLKRQLTELENEVR